MQGEGRPLRRSPHRAFMDGLTGQTTCGFVALLDEAKHAMPTRADCCLWAVTVTLGSCIVVGAFFLGLLGPAHTDSMQYSMSMCLGKGVARRAKGTLVDHKTCQNFGGKVDQHFGLEDLSNYNVEDGLLILEMPFYNTEYVFTRWFQFMITDIDFKFKSSKYIEQLIRANADVMAFDVTIGYRGHMKNEWRVLANGTVVRFLQCGMHSQYDYLTCDMVSLFELGSVHHSRYLVNLRLHFMPLANHVTEFRGLSQLSEVMVLEIHQTKGFTKVWWTLKCVMFPLTTTLLIVFLCKTRGRQQVLMERTLAYMGGAVAFMGVPLEALSLYLDCPWLIVFNDVRAGLVFLSMTMYWVVFIGEHSEVSPTERTLGRYWKELTVVTIGCATLFIYEFCERGVQVLYPFFSLWSTPQTRLLASVFLWVAMAFAALYSLMLLTALIGVWRSVGRKEKMVEKLQESAQVSYRRSMARFKFLLLILVVTATLTIATFIPTEIHEYGLETKSGALSVYSGLLTGSYALWNVYAMIVLVVHVQGSGDLANLRSAWQLMRKTTQD